MNQPITNPNRQHTLNFSAHLGALAAENATSPLPVPTRLSTILEHLRQRGRAREHVEHKLKANQFIMTD
jgi:hypothetical protein